MNRRQRIYFVLLLLTIVLLIFWQGKPSPSVLKPNLKEKADFTEKVNYSFDLARYKYSKIITYLKQNSRSNILYPSYTENRDLKSKKKQRKTDGTYYWADINFWSAGAFPGIIWQLYARESNPQLKTYWREQAIFWSNPLSRKIKKSVQDITLNNLFVFRPWYESSSGQEQNQVLDLILQGTKALANPLNLSDKSGNFAEDMGVFGYFRQADRTDHQEYWHAFIDHTINVEQLLWAAEHCPEQDIAHKWQNIALSHIKILAKSMSRDRNLGQNGTWQRGYFEIDPKAKKYGQFLFNEGKQGWRDDSTWSRGQAWWIYATSVTFKYTQDPEILTIAQQAIDYYFKHLPTHFPKKLRRQGDLIPPWDFDYAIQVNPDTEKDTSAAAIAVSGLLNLVESLPQNHSERQNYLDMSQQILAQLMSSQYLAKPDQGMSLLLHGCYHHYHAISPSQNYDNGLIWGDYFFLDALSHYQQLGANS